MKQQLENTGENGELVCIFVFISCILMVAAFHLSFVVFIPLQCLVAENLFRSLIITTISKCFDKILYPLEQGTRLLFIFAPAYLNMNTDNN